VVEFLREALEWQALRASGEASNQADIARREGITRARVTQVMGMLRLAPDIQQQVLSLPDMVRRPAITEAAGSALLRTRGANAGRHAETRDEVSGVCDRGGRRQVMRLLEEDHVRQVISGGKVSAPATLAIGWPA
jgi:hypothetical protein